MSEMLLLPPSPPQKNDSEPIKEPRAKRQRKSGLVIESRKQSKKNALETVPRNLPPSKLEKRKNDALRRIKVSKSDLAAAPDISSIIRQTPRGKSLVIKALRFSEDPLARAFLAKYDAIPERDRRELSFEAIGLAAGCDLKTLLGEMMLAVREHSVNSVKLIAIAAHPMITKKRVEFAQQPGGFRDRDKLDEMLGAIKPSAGSTFINKFFAATTKEMPEEEDGHVEEQLTDDLDFIFPDASVVQERVQSIRQKVLGEGK
jgi:hypothetical protein